MSQIMHDLSNDRNSNYLMYVTMSSLFELVNTYKRSVFNHTGEIDKLFACIIKTYRVFLGSRHNLYQFDKTLCLVLRVIRLMQQKIKGYNYAVDTSAKIISVMHSCLRSYKSKNMIAFFKSKSIKKRIYELDNENKCIVNSLMIRNYSMIPR